MHLKKFSLLILAFILSAAAVQAQTKSKTPKKGAGVGLKASVAAGQKVFSQYCVSCHQADGLGVPHMNPPLVKTTYVLGDKTKLIKIVLNGFDEDVEING